MDNAASRCRCPCCTRWHNAALLAIEQAVNDEMNRDPALFAYTRKEADTIIDERFEELYQLFLATPAGEA